MFVKVDVNGDGCISKEELANGFEHVDLDIDNIEELMERCDVDGNGYIDYTEFITAAMDWTKALNEERLLHAFKAFDKDGNGTIDLNELRESIGTDSANDESTWIQVMAEGDKNGDGVIDLKEFMTLMIDYVSGSGN